MAEWPFQCPGCQTPLLDTAFDQQKSYLCSGCKQQLQVEVFPALLRSAAPIDSGEILLVDDESACFYHAAKKAVIPCQNCGRFLCALCDCSINDEHFCPQCLDTGKTKTKIRHLDNQRTRYDSIALWLAVGPIALIVFWFLTIVTAPVAIFVAVRYWKAPRSLVSRSGLRMTVALCVAVLETAGWGILMYVLIANRNG